MPLCRLTRVTGLQPLLLGIPWMDPNWLLDHFHTEFVWISLIIIFIECGLLFPFLPGDTLLFSVGLFIATDELNLTSGPNLARAPRRHASRSSSRRSSATSRATRSAAPSVHPYAGTTAGSSRRSTSTGPSSSSRSTAARRW